MRTVHRPPGSGPALARAHQVPRRRRQGVAALGVVLYSAVIGFVAWRGLSWRWAAVTLVPSYVLTVAWMSRRNIVRAGEGWLSRGRNYVQTDRLTVLRAEGSALGLRFALSDDGARSVRLRPSEISRNPDVWQLVRAGVMESRSAGLTPDGPASRYFAL
jgi:hypothetical protein